MKRPLPVAGCLAISLLLIARASSAAQIEIPRHDPCNLFDLKEPVRFTAKFRGLPAGTGTATVVATSYFNETKTLGLPLQAKPGQLLEVPLDLGVLDPGYYEMKITAEIDGSGGKPVIVHSEPISFGVVQFIDRTAAQAREQGVRFGLKIFQIGEPGVWWRKNAVWNLKEVVDACARSGLQWTRHQFNRMPGKEPGEIGTEELISEFPMLVVLKVEGFPQSCFDADRYGPIEEWKAKHKGKSWYRCTVPAKEPYQEWLKTEVAKIPASQNIFEIGNEVWNYMSAEEFAEWCRMCVEAIKQVRPEARIGADPYSGGDFRHRFLAAGGMDGMTIWFCHPYSFTPLPEHRTRAFIRNMRDILKKETGRNFDLYVTEYGWSVAPESSKTGVVSETLQAQRTARQSLMLYSEDAKALIPHWMGDREEDPANWDHWFGFFRLDQQPRPVFVAHATSARMIDGSRFVGDLPLGDGIGAMLFERDGDYTLALSTAEDIRQVVVDVGSPTVTVVDVMGKEKQTRTNAGKLTLRLDGNVTYLVGVSPTLAKLAIPPDRDLDPDVWSKREETVAAVKMAKPPTIDGSLDDWKGLTAIPIPATQNAKVNCQAEAFLGWDAKIVYAAVRVSGESAGDRDVFELALGARPSRQPDMKGTTPYDYLFALSSLDGRKPARLVVSNPGAHDLRLEIEQGNDPSGIRWAVHPSEDGWTGEMAIPVEFLEGVPSTLANYKASFKLTLEHFAPGKKDPVRLVFGDEKPRLWPYLLFRE